MKRSLKIFLNIIIGIAIVLSLYIAIFGSIARKNGDVLTIFGFGYSYVPTESMDGNYTKEDYDIPSFKAGSLLFLNRSNYTDIKMGDVVVYYDQGILKVHRIIEKLEDRDAYYAKGDNASSKDIVSQDNFRAKVTGSIFLMTPGRPMVVIQFAIISIIVIVLIVMLVVQVLKIANRREQLKYKDSLAEAEAEHERLRTQLRDEVWTEIANEHKNVLSDQSDKD